MQAFLASQVPAKSPLKLGIRPMIAYYLQTTINTGKTKIIPPDSRL
ncbi:hypothetical protein NEOC65_002259 [Neochlamydia sp. AcF65]|nr:hypothetical protein [Neochlamydia sp. AcF65]MBS4169465.1 hypothetical protein [Neochlamydia sp. AcF95]